MNKLQLIEALRDQTGLTKEQAKVVVETFFGYVSEALAKGNRVELRGLCSFFVKHYKAYTGRNPKTGERIAVEPKRMPVFKAGLELRDRVDGPITTANVGFPSPNKRC